ncbi:MAG: flagellar basal body rod C-terminal domain-containing protein [Pseudomonadota bacterium]
MVVVVGLHGEAPAVVEPVVQALGRGDGPELAVAVREVAVGPVGALLALGKFDTAAAVGTRALTAGDSRGAEALSDVQRAQTNFDAAGTLQPLTTTISQYAAYVVGNTAVMAETASSRATDTLALQVSVSERRQDVSGVNIDEELAQMVVFQNAYNASARLITTVRQMFDELMSVV